MKTMSVVGLKLALICAVAAIALAGVNALTAPQIEKNKEIRLINSLSIVIPEGLKNDKENNIENNNYIKKSYKMIDNSNNLKGYILKLVGKGYGGDINILASYNTLGELINAVVMENEETAGIGKKAENPKYMEKFIKKGDKDKIPKRKSQLESKEADEITGATITFSGVSSALYEGSEYVKSLSQGSM